MKSSVGPRAFYTFAVARDADRERSVVNSVFIGFAADAQCFRTIGSLVILLWEKRFRLPFDFQCTFYCYKFGLYSTFTMSYIALSLKPLVFQAVIM